VRNPARVTINSSGLHQMSVGKPAIFELHSTDPDSDITVNVTRMYRPPTTALNLLKTVEIVFHRPNVSHNLLPPIMHSVSRVAVAKLLCVHLRHDLNFSQQVESLVATCNQRLYLLAQLKKQGLSISALDSVFKESFLTKFCMLCLFILDT